MIVSSGSYFHLHMVSDSTGETLITIAKAVRVQYAQVRAIEHLTQALRIFRCHVDVPLGADYPAFNR